MLIESYQLEVEMSTHSAEHIEFEVIAHLGVDIGPALAYLNAVLSSAIYVPNKPLLSWRHAGHNIGFWPNRIAVDNLESREEVERMVDLVNQTWEKRDRMARVLGLRLNVRQPLSDPTPRAPASKAAGRTRPRWRRKSPRRWRVLAAGRAFLPYPVHPTGRAGRESPE